jgi:hypothetical protein
MAGSGEVGGFWFGSDWQVWHRAAWQVAAWFGEVGKVWQVGHGGATLGVFRRG